MSTVFAANLGFLWKNLDLLEAAVVAHATGFTAIECHFPYSTNSEILSSHLAQLGIPLLSLNTPIGPRENDFGLAAVPERSDDAHAGIKQAFDYAIRSGAKHVHVMAGRAEWNDASRRTFAQSLELACELSEEHGIGTLIEPLNPVDMPDYCLTNLQQAREIIAEVKSPHLKIMFDCYHVHQQGMSILDAFIEFQPYIGHVQIADLRHRGPPIDAPYPMLLTQMQAAGYDGAFGAEYIFENTPDFDQFDWLKRYQ